MIIPGYEVVTLVLYCLIKTNISPAGMVRYLIGMVRFCVSRGDPQHLAQNINRLEGLVYADNAYLLQRKALILRLKEMVPR